MYNKHTYLLLTFWINSLYQVEFDHFCDVTPKLSEALLNVYKMIEYTDRKCIFQEQ